MKQVTIATVILLIFSATTFCQPANDSLLRIIALNNHDDAEMKALLVLAINCHRADPGKAKDYLAQNIKIATDTKNWDRQCSSYALLLTIFQEEGNIDSSNYCVDKLKTVAANAPNDNKVQGNYNQAMGLYYKKNGNYKTALPYTLAAVKLTEISGGEKKSIAGQWLNAGTVYQLLGDYKNSMDCFLKALRLFEDAGNKMGEAFCYTNIATIYNNLKQYSNALSYAQRSLELKNAIGDKKGVCTALQAIGEAYMGLHNFPQAFSNFQQALKISQDEKMPIDETVCNFNLAKIFAAQKKDSLAINYFNKTKTLAKQLDNKLVAANTELELASLYKSKDSLKHTEEKLVNSLQTFKNAGSLEKESDNYKRLSEFYAANKQYSKALEYANRYHDIADSITGVNVQVQLKKMEAQYNSVKKEKEITLLKKDKELQLQQIKHQQLLMIGGVFVALMALFGIVLLINRNKLRQRMKELELRNRIAADLHDEVGSSLSSIHMLSQIATQHGSDNTQKDILERMSSNAKETMEKMGDIVWMIKPGETEENSLKQRMERFAYEICSAGNIEIKMELNDLDKCRLSMEQRKNIYLIFKEALNNAVRYSGTEKIEVITSVQNKELLLQVNDFGKGFESTIAKKGNGLDNMLHRAKEMNGKLELRSAPGGTIINLVVPV